MRRVVDSELEALLKKVLALPVEARAALAGSLLNSLDQGAAAAWEVEIARRIGDLDSGAVAPIPWSEARRSLLRP